MEGTGNRTVNKRDEMDQHLGKEGAPGPAVTSTGAHHNSGEQNFLAAACNGELESDLEMEK